MIGIYTKISQIASLVTIRVNINHRFFVSGTLENTLQANSVKHDNIGKA